MTLEVKSHSLLLGIFQTGMGLQRKKMFFLQKNYYYILLESLLKTEQIIIKELVLKID